MRIARSTRLVPVALAAALALTACSNDQPASESSDTEPVAATTGGAPDAAAGTTSAGGSAAAEGQTAEVAVEPAAEQTIEVEESMTRSSEGEAFTLTTHRVLVHDYYVEAEVTLVNDGDDELPAWYGSATTMSPRVFDDRGRTYAFQVPAGYDGESLSLQPGEGGEAVLVFAGRVDPEARQLTVDFSELGELWSQVAFEVPLAGRR